MRKVTSRYQYIDQHIKGDGEKPQASNFQYVLMFQGSESSNFFFVTNLSFQINFDNRKDIFSFVS